MKTLINLRKLFKANKDTFGVTLIASKNTFGQPGGSIMEGAYFVRRM